MLQPSFSGSVAEALRRGAGVVVGAAIASHVVANASPRAATIIAAASLVLGFAYISSSIAIFIGALVVTLTLTLAPLNHVDQQTYAVGYAVAVIVGAALAATVGFLSVPAQTQDRRRRVILRSVASTADALDAMAIGAPQEWGPALVRAFREQQNTAVATSARKQHDWDSESSAAIGGLNLVALSIIIGFARRSPSVNRTLSTVADRLRAGAGEPLLPEAEEDLVTGLEAVDQLLRGEYRRLHAAMASWAG